MQKGVLSPGNSFVCAETFLSFIDGRSVGWRSEEKLMNGNLICTVSQRGG